MAERDGVRWWLRLLIDPKSKKQVQSEAQDALDKGTDPKKAKKNLKEADGAFARIGATAKKVGVAIAGAFAIGLVVNWTKRIVAAGKAVFDLGASVGETASKFEITFGAAKKQVDDFISSWALMAGLTRTQARDMSATFAAISQGMGATQQASADLSERVLRLAGDLISFHDVPIEESLRALRSGLVGQSEPLQKFGIMLKAETVNQRALNTALREGRTEITELDRMLARLEIAYEQAGVSVGNLEETQDSQQNQSRRSAAAFQQIKESIAALLVEGFAAVPVFEDLGAGFEGVSTWIDENEESVRDLGTAFAHVASAVISAASAFAGFISWLERVDTAVDRWIAKHGPTAAGRRQARARLGEDWTFSTGTIGNDPAAEEAERQREQAEAAQARAEAARAAAEDAAKAAKAAERQRKREAAKLERDLTPRLGLVGTPDRWNRAMAPGSPAENLAFMRELGAESMALLPDSVEALREREPMRILEDWQMALQDNWAGIESAGMGAAMGVAGAWQDAFSLLFEEGANLEDFMGELASGIAGAMLGGVAEFASGKVAENMAAALEAAAYALGFGAKGLFPNAAAAWSAAAQHTAAAGAWGALAGGAGAGQGAVAGGGRGGLSGGVPTGARDIGGRIADRQRGESETHIHMYGDFDALNPRVQQVVHGAYELGRQSAGKHVRLHHHRGRS